MAMSFSDRLKSIGLDFYLVLLVGTVALATLLPARGQASELVSLSTHFAVALLFFLYGTRLDTSAVVEGMTNWRLQAMVLTSTFVLFPVLGIVLGFLVSPYLGPEIAMGLIYVSILPSTVQSSIAFTSLAHGNVPAAVCAASVSNVIGVVLTPAMAAILLHTGQQGFDFGAVFDIGVQILLPFVVGQVLRPLLGGWIKAHPKLTRVVDRGSILLIVYSAFSAGVIAGIWHQLDAPAFAIMIVADIVLLAIVMVTTWLSARLAGLPYRDAIVLLFAGSKKSLASGLPMANILFAGQAVSLIVLPLMLFHQIQLFVCAIIAQRQAFRIDSEQQAMAHQRGT